MYNTETNTNFLSQRIKNISMRSHWKKLRHLKHI